MTSIEWTDETWNPVTGCTKISEECRNCYAERMAKRLKAMGQPRYNNGFNVSVHEEALDKPIQWKKPKKIFVNSMSDLFHEDVPKEFIDKVYDVMAEFNMHTYQILTKRPERMAEFCSSWSEGRYLPKHIWVGTSVESMEVVSRIDDLSRINGQ